MLYRVQTLAYYVAPSEITNKLDGLTLIGFLLWPA